MFDHISLGTTDLERSLAFYQPVLATLGLEIAYRDKDAVGFSLGGKDGHGPKFWIDVPLNESHPATAGNGTHIAFAADSQAAVHAFHAAALAHGGTDNGPPGPRPDYGPDYYGAFVIDPDGHKIEAVCRLSIC